jgi:hypothetical protein
MLTRRRFAGLIATSALTGGALARSARAQPPVIREAKIKVDE